MKNHMEIVAALEALRPGEWWSLIGDSYEGLEWLDKTDKPTEAELVNIFNTLNYVSINPEL